MMQRRRATSRFNMSTFNKNIIISDTAFEFPNFIYEDKISEMSRMEKYFKGSKIKDIEEKIITIAGMNNLDPQLVANILLTTEINNMSRLSHVGDVAAQLHTKARMIRRFYDGGTLGKKVKIMDDEEVMPVNLATLALYQIIPFVGENDLYTYDRSADKEGNIIDVQKVLKETAPFGVYRFWLNIDEYDMRRLRSCFTPSGSPV